MVLAHARHQGVTPTPPCQSGYHQTATPPIRWLQNSTGCHLRAISYGEVRVQIWSPVLREQVWKNDWHGNKALASRPASRPRDRAGHLRSLHLRFRMARPCLPASLDQRVTGLQSEASRSERRADAVVTARAQPHGARLKGQCQWLFHPHAETGGRGGGRSECGGSKSSKRSGLKAKCAMVYASPVSDASNTDSPKVKFARMLCEPGALRPSLGNAGTSPPWKSHCPVTATSAVDDFVNSI